MTREEEITHRLIQSGRSGGETAHLMRVPNKSLVTS